MSTSTVTEVMATAVKAGQRITEVDTPEGPFYEVAKVNPKSLVVYIDPEHPEDGTVRLPVRVTDIVLVQTKS